jgi:hypothetical protein
MNTPNQPNASNQEKTNPPKKGFLAALFDRVDTAMRQAAEKKGSSCCGTSGDGKDGKGGKCC